METRQETSYDRLLNFVNKLCVEKTGNQIDTNLFVVDNEMAAINAFSKIIDFQSDSRDIKLCSFHVNKGFRDLFRTCLGQEISRDGEFFNESVYEIYVQILKLYLLPLDIIFMLLGLITSQIALTEYSSNETENIRITSILSEIIEKVRKSVCRNETRISWHNIILDNQQSFIDCTNNRYRNWGINWGCYILL